ncbi:hypothetical protein ACSBPU_05595 [Parapusillimonas sp. JC17]|uniref:hypothetical protein n=1 Tax=Parapusillimonas sp. JC17 TaxID=3445768 RepID=UPI003F9F6E30
MADFYADMAKMARDLLAPTGQGGLGQGAITLTHTTPGVSDPTKPWEPVEPTKQTETLRCAVRGVDARLVGTEMGSAVLLATDRVAICEVPAIEYTAGDTLAVDERPVIVLAVEKIPAAGTPSAVKFFIRG